MRENSLKAYIAEFIGTFFLVFLGCGAAVLTQIPQFDFPVFGVGAVFGLTVAVMVYAVGHVSGAHLNPAVSIAFCAVRHFPLHKVMGYVTAQILGAIAASSLHLWLFSNEGHNFGASLPAGPLVPALILEMIISFMLMFVIMSVATDTRAQGEMAGLAIGGAVAIAAWTIGPLTGASMNPARSIGPAIFSANLNTIWIYVLGPILGALLGALSYRWIRCPDPKPKNDGSPCC